LVGFPELCLERHRIPLSEEESCYHTAYARNRLTSSRSLSKFAETAEVRLAGDLTGHRQHNQELAISRRALLVRRLLPNG